MESFGKLVPFVSVYKDPRRTSSFVELKHIGRLSFGIRAFGYHHRPTLKVNLSLLVSIYFLYINTLIL